MVQLDFAAVNLVPKAGQAAVVPGLDLHVTLLHRNTPPITGVELFVEISALGSVIATTSPTYYETWAPNEQRDFRFFITTPHYLLQAIEAVRADDVPLSLNVRGMCFIGQPGQLRWERIYGSYEYPRSQKQWLEILRALAYSDRWIVELERPKIVGFEGVSQHVLKAFEAIQLRDYEGAVHNCRVAWDAASPLLDTVEKEMAIEIDRNSPGETGYPRKSQRINTLRRDLLSWAQIGAHKEFYAVTGEDALLCYRLTLSMFSYLTKVASLIKKP